MLNIIEELIEEFEQVNSGLSNPQEKWNQSKFSNFSPPLDYCNFLTIVNGMKRVKEDEYFTFQLYPFNKLKNFPEIMGIEEEITNKEGLEQNREFYTDLNLDYFFNSFNFFLKFSLNSHF